jgi:hypothetical protein
LLISVNSSFAAWSVVAGYTSTKISCADAARGVAGRADAAGGAWAVRGRRLEDGRELALAREHVRRAEAVLPVHHGTQRGRAAAAAAELDDRDAAGPAVHRRAQLGLA